MDSALRTRLEKHIISAQAKIFRSIVGGSFEVLPDWARGYSGLQIPTFNVFMPRRPAGLNDETLADTAAFFSSRNVVYAVELVHDQMPFGPDFLAERRYVALPPQPAMALRRLPAEPPPPSEISITAVATVPGLTAFCSLQNAVFDFSFQDLRRLFPVAQLKDNKIYHYLAFLNEQPVAAGSLVCAEGVGSVWNLGTLDQFRRLGVASYLLRYILSEAAQKECSAAMVYSSAQAYKFFSRMGFEIFTQRQWFLPQNIEYEVEDS
ncbi:MAG: hypothetical protein FOGNACKC_03041 [Anaerolineae bacterium]|nr:hypothetical protein [Anaerolineae bacterium]